MFPILTPIEIGVPAALLQKIHMGAGFCDQSVLDGHDPVRAPNRRQPVRDDDDGSPGRDRLQIGLDHLFGFCVQLQCGVDPNIAAAQVQLAKRYEPGDGVPRNFDRAVALYERAATPIPPTTAIYSLPVRLGGRRQMIFLNNPNAEPGSAKAQYRLDLFLIEGCGVKQDVERGNELIERAARQRFAPAIGHFNSLRK